MSLRHRMRSLAFVLAIPVACSPAGQALDGPDLARPVDPPGTEGLPPLPAFDTPWRFEHPLPQGNALYGVVVDGAEAFAVGQLGAVVHLTEAGAVQEAIGATPAALFAVLRIDKTLWAVGDSGSVLRGKDGRYVALRAGALPLFALWTEGQTIHCAGQGATSWRYDGQRFQPQALPGFGPGDVVRAAAAAFEDSYLVGSSGRILHRERGNWFLEGDGLTTLDLLSVAVLDDGAVYAAGVGGRILRRDPQTRRWALDHPLAQGGAALTRAELRAIFAADRVPYAIGADGTVLRRGDTGWALFGAVLPLSPGAGARAAAAGPAGTYVVGDGGLILSRGPAPGAPFLAPPGTAQLTTAALQAVSADGPAAYAVADDGAIWRREVGNGAPSFRADYTPSPSPGQPLLAVAARGGEAYAVGMAGLILRRSNQGWQAESYPWPDRRPDWKGVTILPSGEVYAVGTVASDVEAEAAILRKAGGAWARERPQPRVLTALFAVSGDDTTVLAVGSKGTLLRRAGPAWVGEDQGAFDDVQLLSITKSGGTFYAAGTSGVVLQREAAMGGARWTRVKVPGAGTLSALANTSVGLFAAGQGGLAARLFGGVWTIESTGAMAHLYGLTQVGAEIVAVGSGGAVLRRPGEIR